ALGSADFDEQNAHDDQADACEHAASERIAPDQPCGEGDDDDADRGPQPVRHSHRHARVQGKAQCDEGDEVADDDRNQPAPPPQAVAGTQAQGAGHLAADGEQQPDRAHVPAPSSVSARSAWAPDSTRATPTVMTTMPATAPTLSRSPKITAPRMATKATPVAPQIPYATPIGMPARNVNPIRVNAAMYAATTRAIHAR